MGQFFLYLLLLTIVFCYITTTSVTVTSLYQAFSNIPHNKIRNKYMHDLCLYRIVLISANTQGYNIGIVSEVKKLYRDIPNEFGGRRNLGNELAELQGWVAKCHGWDYLFGKWILIGDVVYNNLELSWMKLIILHLEGASDDHLPLSRRQVELNMHSTGTLPGEMER